jgi:hypothetical protein
MRVCRCYSRTCSAIGCAVDRIVHSVALLEDSPGRSKIPAKEISNATKFAPHQQHGCIVPCLPDLLYFLRERQRTFLLTSNLMEAELPVEQRKKIIGSIP